MLSDARLVATADADTDHAARLRAAASAPAAATTGGALAGWGGVRGGLSRAALVRSA